MRFPARHTTAGFLLANYILLLAGIPLPVPVAKDPSRPYPCQHHHCGCRSAEQCWRSCCCMSQEEKLAWARENGVTPPADLVAIADRSDTATERACCATNIAHDHKAHDLGSAHCKQCVARPAPKGESQPSVDFVMTVRALGCQGQSGSWVATTPAVIPADVELVNNHTGRVEPLALRESLFLSVVLTFDPPPPRA